MCVCVCVCVCECVVCVCVGVCVGVLSVHLSQGVVTCRSRLEAFANGIKIESSGFGGPIRGSR